MSNISTEIVETGVALFYQKGYLWFKKNMPSIIKELEMQPEHHALLSEVYCIIGELYDLNGAPLQAIETYQKAIAFDDTWASPFQEMAIVLAQVGRYFEAFQQINLAIEKDPDNTELLDEKQEHQDNMNYDVEPLYTENNEIWKLDECLAQEQFDMVVTKILNKKTQEIELLKCLNRAYGALGNVEKYLENWQQIKTILGSTALDYGDWFYMPREIFNTEEMILWRKEFTF